MRDSRLTFDNAVNMTLAMIAANKKGFLVNTEFGKVVVEVTKNDLTEGVYPFREIPLTPYTHRYHMEGFDYYIPIPRSIKRDKSLLQLAVKVSFVKCIIHKILQKETFSIDTAALAIALKEDGGEDFLLKRIAFERCYRSYPLTFGAAKRKLIDVEFNHLKGDVERVRTDFTSGKEIAGTINKLLKSYQDKDLDAMYREIMYYCIHDKDVYCLDHAYTYVNRSEKIVAAKRDFNYYQADLLFTIFKVK